MSRKPPILHSVPKRYSPASLILLVHLTWLPGPGKLQNTYVVGALSQNCIPFKVEISTAGIVKGWLLINTVGGGQ